MVEVKLTELELNLLKVILEILKLLVGDGIVDVLSRHFGGYVLRLNKMGERKKRMLDAEGRFVEEGELVASL